MNDDDVTCVRSLVTSQECNIEILIPKHKINEKICASVFDPRVRGGVKEMPRSIRHLKEISVENL